MGLARKWAFVILLLLSVFILLPPIVHQYWYPNGGDDTANHLIVMEQVSLAHPRPPIYNYDGQWMVGYLLQLVKAATGLPLATSFLWFNYLALIGVLLTVYFITSKFFGRTGGIVTAVLYVFIVQIVLQQFMAGLIFNMINMSIIFLWMVYALCWAIVQRKWEYSPVVAGLVILFMRFHATGNYLPLAGFHFRGAEAKQAAAGGLATRVITWPDVSNYLAVALVLVLVIGLAFYQAKRAWMTQRIMALFIFIVGCFALILTAVAWPGFSFSVLPERPLQDAIAMSVIPLGFLVSILIQRVKVPAEALAFGAAGISMAMLFSNWVIRDFSSVKSVDKQAIDYVNSLGIASFYGNEYVSPPIYGQYVKAAYQPDGQVYIWRSEPMTMGTNPDNPYYWHPRSADVAPPFPFEPITMHRFEADGVTVAVSLLR